jgi:hypothetical protein
MLMTFPEQRLSFLALLVITAFLSGCGSRSNPLASQSSNSPSVTIEPSTVEIFTGRSQPFFAQIVFPKGSQSGSAGSGASNLSVTWMVNGIPGGDSVTGTFDNKGVYSAPKTLPSPSFVKVTAVVNSLVSAPATITLYESGNGQLTINPSSFQFGNVTVGTQLGQTGTLTADKSSVTVYSAKWNGPGFSLSGISFPLTIPAGKTATFTASFAPQTVGTAAGTLSFFTNAANPVAPEQLDGGGVSVQHKVDLSWIAVPLVQGYYVYRGIQTGGPYAKVSALQASASYVDSTVASGQSYYYVVTSYSAGSGESNYSSEVKAVIPATP